MLIVLRNFSSPCDPFKSLCIPITLELMDPIGKNHQSKNWPGAQKTFCWLLLTIAVFDLGFLAD